MSEKMTDEELGQALNVLEAHSGFGVKVRAHVAALTAEVRERKERGEAIAGAAGYVGPVSGLPARVQAIADERDAIRVAVANCAACAENVALRERVKALEAERVRLTEHVKATIGGLFGPEVVLLHGGRNLPEWEAHAKALESRLAAIRQRAEEHLTSPSEEGRAVARYILGDDAPAPSEMSGLEGEMVERPRCGCAGGGACHGGTACLRGPVPAPATTEAFATLKKRRQWWVEHGEGTPAGNEARQDIADLSLLERRMGAQDWVLCLLVAWDADGRQYGLTRIIEQAKAALTDVPPVFTLAEVEALISRHMGPQGVPDAFLRDWEAIRSRR